MSKMEFTGVEFQFLIIMIPLIYTEAGLNLEKDNVCLKTITYNETMKAGIHKPTSKEDPITCLKEGKNCDGELTAKAEEPRVITRTKIIPSCCEGYEEDQQGTQCVPICPRGCGSGKCVAPGECFCNAGFYGPECDQICGEGKWGENCLQECNCSENEECDKMSGCICKPGWTGHRCTKPCPEGYYGFLCKKKCFCDAHLCDSTNGSCTKPIMNLNVLPVDGGNKINQESKMSPSNISLAENQAMIKLIHVEDFVLNATDLLKNTSQNEVLEKNITAILGENDETPLTNSTYFKPEEVRESKHVENSNSPHGVHLKEKQNLEGPLQAPETSSAVFNSSEGSNKIDVWNELITNLTALREKSFRKNGEFGLDSDGHIVVAGNEKSSRAGNFIPTFSVLSGVVVLILIIAGKWLLAVIRKKVKKLGNVELGYSNEELNILSSEKFTWENNMDNPVYVPEPLREVPILQTFKPVTAEMENTSAKKKIGLLVE